VDSVGRTRDEIFYDVFLCMRARYFRPRDPGIYSYAMNIPRYTTMPV